MVEAGLLDHICPLPRGLDYSGLEVLPPVREERWRGFCTLTGFPIAALPVERSLRRGVERPEEAVIPTLALKAKDLMAMGLQGPEISAAQRKLALHVLDHRSDNTAERLRDLLKNPF